jgi:hypothetical protein
MLGLKCRSLSAIDDLNLTFLDIGKVGITDSALAAAFHFR